MMKGSDMSPSNQFSKVSTNKDEGLQEIVVVDDDDTLNQSYLREQTECNLM